MKNRFFNLLLVLLFLFVLVGCTEPKPYEEELLNSYLSSVTVTTTVKEDFTLPYQVNGKTDHKITWTSSNNDVLTITFNESELLYNVTVTKQEEKTAVTLTATFTLDSGLSKEKEFSVLVVAEEVSKPLKEQFDCITIAEAIQIANQSGETESAESYYVYGKIVLNLLEMYLNLQ